MKRREFIALVGMSAAWPAVGTAQQPPTLGLLSSTDLSEWFGNGFRAGLEQTGYVEGRNLTVIYRSAENQFTRSERVSDARLVEPLVWRIIANIHQVRTFATLRDMLLPKLLSVPSAL